MPGIIDDAGPKRFSFAANHGFGVEGDFVGTEGGVEAAHDNRDAPFSVLGGNLVGAFGGVSFDADGGQIGWFIERYLLHAIVVEAHVDVPGSQAGEGGGG